MNKRKLGQGLEVSPLGLGCMGMSEFYGPRDDAQSLQVLERALELGVTFLDTADMYGRHHNEELLGTFLRNRRDQVCLATKFGIVRQDDVAYDRTVNNSPAYARSSCEASLKRLGTDHIDLYYVHRVEQDRPIEEVMGALSDLVTEGKIRHIGLCEVSPQTLRRAHAVHPITAVQTEYSLWTRDVEDEILPTCRELGIGFVPYSPLGRGFLTGTFTTQTTFSADDFRGSMPRFRGENLAINQSIVEKVKTMASAKGCSPAQIALAWLLAQGDDVVPIPGTKRIKYLEENWASVDVKLSSDEVVSLGKAMEQTQVVGERYTEAGMIGLNA